MSICIISTGDELLRGAISDTNAAWMAARLNDRGYVVERITIVGDDLSKIADTLAESFGIYDYIVVSGGLGPTDDDLTAQAAALATGRPIRRNALAAQQIESAFKRIGRPMVEVNLKQADLPDSCSILQNQHGTAPGFSLDTPKGQAFFLPGVPRELKHMFETYVLAGLPSKTASTHRETFRCFGRGESDVQAELKPIAADHPTVRWSFRASFPELSVMITAPNAPEREAVSRKIRSALGPIIFSTKDISLPAAFGERLAAKNLTVGTGESCTGGLIGHAITETAGSSAYFRGSVVAYHNDVKTGLLNVSAQTLARAGAVSEAVVREMAIGVQRALNADVGIAVSGVAGPGGGTPEKPVGLVHFAVAHPAGIDHKQRIFSGFDRSRVKHISAWTAIYLAYRAISEGFNKC
ncbi:MAG: CinA family nicotinamide mononucleotide deamidase-related protein [Myxococcota bacterium]|nr:CinA family nicotinamide mononucleotide deamidase-related protein [Myxococcota bacterium]